MRKVRVGTVFSTWVNQGWREAEILAIIGKRALIEYVMPNGTSALRTISWGKLRPDEITGKFVHDDWFDAHRVSYRNIPKKWLREVVKEEMPWWGYPQRSDTRMPSPRELWNERYPKES